MTIEIWKPVIELVDTYEVSNRGRVRRRTTITSTKAGRLLKLSLSRDGYHQVGLSRPGSTAIGRRVHRLVWEAFKGPIAQGHVINHINGVKTDNRLENLEAITCRANTLHAFRVLGRSRPGEKLQTEDIETIRKRRATGETLKCIAKSYSVTEACISSVCSGKTWIHARGPITPKQRYRQYRNDVMGRIDTKTIDTIKKRYKAGESSRSLAKEFNVSDVTILNWIHDKYRTQK